MEKNNNNIIFKSFAKNEFTNPLVQEYIDQAKTVFTKINWIKNLETIADTIFIITTSDGKFIGGMATCRFSPDSHLLKQENSIQSPFVTCLYIQEEYKAHNYGIMLLKYAMTELKASSLWGVVEADKKKLIEYYNRSMTVQLEESNNKDLLIIHLQ